MGVIRASNLGKHGKFLRQSLVCGRWSGLEGRESVRRPRPPARETVRAQLVLAWLSTVAHSIRRRSRTRIHEPTRRAKSTSKVTKIAREPRHDLSRLRYNARPLRTQRRDLYGVGKFAL